MPASDGQRLRAYRNSTATRSAAFILASASTLMSRGIGAAARLEEEPDAPFGFVNPNLNEAGGGNIPPFLADVVNFSQPACKRLVVFHQLLDHVLPFHIHGVVVQYAFLSRDLADRAYRGLANLSDP